MKTFRRILTCVLAALMLLSCFVACGGTCGGAKETPAPTVEAQADTPKPTAEPTEAPTPEPTEEPTPEPTEVPLQPGDLDADFLALDKELYVWYVSSDITTLDQYCRHPENFGIDESTVEVTLGHFTEESNNEWVENCVQWKDKLATIDREGLSEHLQFAYDTYMRFFDGEIESKDWFYNYEPLDIYVGIHADLPLEFGLYSFRDEQDVKNYMTLLADVPRYMGEILAFEQERANRGWFMTESALDQILKDVDEVAKSAKTSFLHGTFKEAMENADFLTDEQKKEYIKQNDELVRTSWVDGYKLLYDGLKELRPQCRKAVGAYEQGGAAYDYYCWKIQHDGNSNRTVKDAIAFLDSSLNTLYNLLIECIYADYDRFVSGQKITTGSLGGDEAYLRSLMPQIVPEMPQVEVNYVEVPKELQDSFSPAAYMRPAADDYEHNIILTNPKDQDDYDMSTLAHEGFPGHMYQFVYQYSLGTIPNFQMIIETSGYAESWSTNSELNIARVNERYGTNYALGLFYEHYFENTLIQYCSLLVNGQGKKKADIRSYLARWNMDAYTDLIYDRAIEMPVYYFKYVLGFNELFNITEKCKNQLGGKFSYIDFHEEYLSWGPGAFYMLREKMQDWVKTKKQ